MLLARDGHEVAVLERDPTPAPDAIDAAWTEWELAPEDRWRLVAYIRRFARD